MTARRVFEWLADSGRFLGAMLYWNVRKSAYVARGRRGHCPCQNASDDSVPGRVRCDAMVHWHEPARFRRICPLLVSTPEGWRCSVHAPHVRPFWGRVAAWVFLGAVLAYGAAGLMVFCVLRISSDAPVRFSQVMWPPKWREVRAVQSQELFAHAIEAFSRGQLREAYIALASAQQRDPANYDASLMLAQIAMFEHSFLASDEQFERLRRTHPLNAVRTAITYHDALLSLDRMDRLAAFSLGMAQADQPRAAVWVRSALLAVRSMGAADLAAFRSRNSAAISALAPHAQLLLRAEFQLCDARPDLALQILRAPFGGPLNPFYATYQVRRVAELGAIVDAQVLLDFYGPVLGDFDHQLAQFALSSTAHDRTTARLAFRNVLRLPFQAKRVERIAAALIAHPDGDLFQEFSSRIQREPALAAEVSGAALWVTGLVSGEPDAAAYWQTHGSQRVAPVYPLIRGIDFTTRDLASPSSVNHLVNTLSLPRDVIVELLWRVAPQDAAAKRPRILAD